MNSPNPLLEVKNLQVSFASQNKVVDDISFNIYRGETFALVGESGSGKSITALSVLRLLPYAAKMRAGILSLQGTNLLAIPEIDFAKIRSRRIGLIFQDSMSALNPVMTIGEQIAEVLNLHFQLAKQNCQQQVLELLEQVEIPDPKRRINEYPHQMSGGQRQRVMIAMALAGKPDLLIADEPTTALDVTIQAQVLTLMKNLQKKTGMALWIITHDLALVSNIADRIAVMQQGKIVETANTRTFFEHPQHPYSLKLLAAQPDMNSCLQKNNDASSTLLQVNDLKVYYPIRAGIFKRIVGHVKAVDGVSFSLQKGKTLAMVGESGCGKTSLGKSLLNLTEAGEGHIVFDGVELQQSRSSDLHRRCTEMQIIFQDPFSAMNPRMLVGDIVEEGLRSLRPEFNDEQRKSRVAKLLQQVDLPANSALRYPHEFSGGQRQRICIARALAVEPKLIICDEPTSALDVSVQAQIIALLKQLQKEQGLSYLLITHNFGVVAEMADEVAVMYKGKIVEQGMVEQVLMHPQHEYTQSLLQAVPKIDFSKSNLQ
ncbi:ABC transporter ATP-binding protein [Methylomonas sp. AM2-LC]|uniref:ABC transporter ATP-binding protein n=1 Tax=Methylomonas sp. AM2-LC TaxID=3153301 RepID=UPI0032646727